MILCVVRMNTFRVKLLIHKPRIIHWAVHAMWRVALESRALCNISCSVIVCSSYNCCQNVAKWRDTVLQSSLKFAVTKVGLSRFSIYLSIVVTIFNFVMTVLAERVTMLELHTLTSNYVMSLLTKLVIFYFVNSFVVPILAVSHNSNESSTDKSWCVSRACFAQQTSSNITISECCHRKNIIVPDLSYPTDTRGKYH